VFGWDPEPGLVAFALAPSGSGMRVWRRVGETVESRLEPFAPFLLAAREDLARAPASVTVTRLQGPGELAWLACFASWGEALAARDWCRARTTVEAGNADALWYFVGDPVEQYLLTTGRGSFGGLAFEALRRIALDIEVITTEGHEFPNAAREGDRIVAVALADSSGFRHVIRGDRLDERALLEECTRLVRERDPDVIEGHNVFRFDLEYLELRARRHGVTLAWGRDGSPLRGRPSRLSIAERAIGYRRYEVAGRHIADTWMLAQLHDLGSRDFPSFGLKDVARHLGVAPAGRTYVDGAQVTRAFREAPDRLMAYAGDDALETLEVAARLAPPYFVQATLVPFDYQSTILRGTATKIDALLLREYLRRGHAVPVPRPGAGVEVGGGHTAIYRQGVAAPVLHADVTSLYPSLMLARSITPSRDALGVFPAILRALRAYRVRAKRAARESDDPTERAHLEALQACFKLLINSFYGYLAFTRGHWNDYEAANRVTAEGRSVVLGLIERLEALGAVPIEADTDGVYFVPPPGHVATDDEALVQRLAADLEPALQLELDGRYPAMFSYRMKTYALLDESGRVRPRGSAFRSRALEPFQRVLIAEIVRLLLTRRGAEIKAVIDGWLEAFAAHRVAVTAFARTETLQDTPEVYRDKVREGLRVPSAAYELAEASGRSWQPGDQITYYVAGRGLRATVNEQARLARDWDPKRPDENVEHYQSKVLEVWERFRRFAGSDELVPYTDEPGDSAQLTLF
jgi:DNA polymerase elongation subunit (family B)